MKITQAAIQLNSRKYTTELSVSYNLTSFYLTLNISEWLEAQSLDVGRFNRIVFEEGSRFDLEVVGDRAFAVRLSESTMDEGSPFRVGGIGTYGQLHQYFVRKYLEGFKRFDAHFGLALSPKLELFLAGSSAEKYVFEKLAGKYKIDIGSLEMLHRYWPDRYELIARIASANGHPPEERVLLELIPDPFKVHYHVAKIEVEGRRVTITNRTDSGVEVREL